MSNLMSDEKRSFKIKIFRLDWILFEYVSWSFDTGSLRGLFSVILMFLVIMTHNISLTFCCNHNTVTKNSSHCSFQYNTHRDKALSIIFLWNLICEMAIQTRYIRPNWMWMTLYAMLQCLSEKSSMNILQNVYFCVLHERKSIFCELLLSAINVLIYILPMARSCAGQRSRHTHTHELQQTQLNHR